MLERPGLLTKTAAFLSIGIVTTVFGCGGNDSPPPDEAQGGEAGDTSSAGSGGESGSATGGMGGSTAGAGAAGYACAHEEPPNANITDFLFFTGDVASCSWGDDQSLTGGCFRYDGDMDDSVHTLSSTLSDESLNVTGDVVNYAGFGFWFGPCVDASGFDGISFSISGSLGDNQLEIQVQSSKNYPIDNNNTKGECEGEWSDGCNSNKFIYTEDMIGEDPTTVEVRWSDLTDGEPVDPLDPSELLGLQWQFNCASGAICPVDATFDDVFFMDME